MKTNLRNYKFAVFSALVLSMIIPFAGINMAHAIQTTVDPYHIGKVADGTYNETAAFQRATQLMKISEEKIKEKQDLEKKLVTATLSTEIESIKSQINNIQGQIDGITQEFNMLQDENLKFYYIDPVLYGKYQNASDNFVKKIQTQYWKGKSFDENKKSFPLVGIGVNNKAKAIEIDLWKGIENSTQKDQYINIIKENIPKDVPWKVNYIDYYKLLTCDGTRCTSFSPRIGGIEVDTDEGNGQLSICTLGFKATRNTDNAVGFVTAGHCTAGYTGNNVYQPYSTIIGVASTSVFSNGSDCDCGWVKLNSGVSISDSIYNTPSTTYTPTSATPQGSGQAVGMWVQKSGITTGITTGQITMADYTLVSGGITIFHTVQTNVSASSGDSGSPFTKMDSTNSLFGVLSASNGVNTVYSPENRAAADLGVTIAVG